MSKEKNKKLAVKYSEKALKKRMTQMQKKLESLSDVETRVFDENFMPLFFDELYDDSVVQDKIKKFNKKIQSNDLL